MKLKNLKLKSQTKLREKRMDMIFYVFFVVPIVFMWICIPNLTHASIINGMALTSDRPIFAGGTTADVKEQPPLFDVKSEPTQLTESNAFVLLVFPIILNALVILFIIFIARRTAAYLMIRAKIKQNKRWVTLLQKNENKN